jgi:hypothetical protein
MPQATPPPRAPWPPSKSRGQAQSAAGAASPDQEAAAADGDSRRRSRASGCGGRRPLNWAGGGAVVVLVVVLLLVVLLPPGDGVSTPVSTPTKVPASVLTAVTDPGNHTLCHGRRGGAAGGAQPADRDQAAHRLRGEDRGDLRWRRVLPLLRRRAVESDHGALPVRHLHRSQGDVVEQLPTSIPAPAASPSWTAATRASGSTSRRWRRRTRTRIRSRRRAPRWSRSSPPTTRSRTRTRPPVSPRFPFLDIGGDYVLYQTSFDPAILQGLSWKQIAADLGNAGQPGDARHRRQRQLAHRGDLPRGPQPAVLRLRLGDHPGHRDRPHLAVEPSAADPRPPPGWRAPAARPALRPALRPSRRRWSVWRRRWESNPRSGFCRPVPYHLATSPQQRGYPSR